MYRSITFNMRAKLIHHIILCITITEQKNNNQKTIWICRCFVGVLLGAVISIAILMRMCVQPPAI